MRVKRAGGLVEHENGRIAEDRPRDGQSLLFAAGEAVAPLADQRVVAVWQPCEKVVDLGGPCGGVQFLVRGLRLRE